MKKVILIFAQCVNSKALGDFSHAGAIARDFAEEIQVNNLDYQVILSSSETQIENYKVIYEYEA